MLMLECIKNKLAKHRGNPPKEDEYYYFWRLFGQCLVNVWPFAYKSPQTASDGVVCLAKIRIFGGKSRFVCIKVCPHSHMWEYLENTNIDARGCS